MWVRAGTTSGMYEHNARDYTNTCCVILASRHKDSDIGECSKKIIINNLHLSRNRKEMTTEELEQIQDADISKLHILLDVNQESVDWFVQEKSVQAEVHKLCIADIIRMIEIYEYEPIPDSQGRYKKEIEKIEDHENTVATLLSSAIMEMELNSENPDIRSTQNYIQARNDLKRVGRWDDLDVGFQSPILLNSYLKVNPGSRYPAIEIKDNIEKYIRPDNTGSFASIDFKIHAILKMAGSEKYFDDLLVEFNEFDASEYDFHNINKFKHQYMQPTISIWFRGVRVESVCGFNDGARVIRWYGHNGKEYHAKSLSYLMAILSK